MIIRFFNAEVTPSKLAAIWLVATLFLAAPTPSQQQQGRRLAPDAPDRKHAGGFGAYLIVVENPLEVVREWLKPQTPNIKTADVVRRGDHVGALVLFAGCKQDGRGACDTEVDYVIYKPDGSVYAERKEQPLWKELAPPPPVTQLGRAILSFRMGRDRPLGEYMVKAQVRDLNGGVTLELETKFRLMQ